MRTGYHKNYMGDHGVATAWVQVTHPCSARRIESGPVYTVWVYSTPRMWDNDRGEIHGPFPSYLEMRRWLFDNGFRV